MSARKYAADEAGIAAAADAIRDGGVVVYPTETCYGIGGDALNRVAIDRVYELKQRPRSKPLTVIVSSLEMAEKYCYLDAHERHLVKEFMPGPLTLLADKKSVVPDELNDKFAFRIPGNETARELVGEAGMPVIATSANISGEPANFAVDTIDPVLLHDVDVVLDGGTLEEKPSSTIISVEEDRVRVHREGPISPEEIHKVLNE